MAKQSALSEAENIRAKLQYRTFLIKRLNQIYDMKSLGGVEAVIQELRKETFHTPEIFFHAMSTFIFEGENIMTAAIRSNNFELVSHILTNLPRNREVKEFLAGLPLERLKEEIEIKGEATNQKIFHAINAVQNEIASLMPSAPAQIEPTLPQRMPVAHAYRPPLPAAMSHAAAVSYPPRPPLPPILRPAAAPVSTETMAAAAAAELTPEQSEILRALDSREKVTGLINLINELKKDSNIAPIRNYFTKSLSDRYLFSIIRYPVIDIGNIMTVAIRNNNIRLVEYLLRKLQSEAPVYYFLMQLPIEQLKNEMAAKGEIFDENILVSIRTKQTKVAEDLAGKLIEFSKLQPKASLQSHKTRLQPSKDEAVIALFNLISVNYGYTIILFQALETKAHLELFEIIRKPVIGIDNIMTVAIQTNDATLVDYLLSKIPLTKQAQEFLEKLPIEQLKSKMTEQGKIIDEEIFNNINAKLKAIEKSLSAEEMQQPQAFATPLETAGTHVVRRNVAPAAERGFASTAGAAAASDNLPPPLIPVTRPQQQHHAMRAPAPMPMYVPMRATNPFVQQGLLPMKRRFPMPAATASGTSAVTQERVPPGYLPSEKELEKQTDKLIEDIAKGNITESAACAAIRRQDIKIGSIKRLLRSEITDRTDYNARIRNKLEAFPEAIADMPKLFNDIREKLYKALSKDVDHFTDTDILLSYNIANAEAVNICEYIANSFEQRKKYIDYAVNVAMRTGAERDFEVIGLPGEYVSPDRNHLYDEKRITSIKKEVEKFFQENEGFAGVWLNASSLNKLVRETRLKRSREPRAEAPVTAAFSSAVVGIPKPAVGTAQPQEDIRRQEAMPQIPPLMRAEAGYQPAHHSSNQWLPPLPTTLPPRGLHHLRPVMPAFAYGTNYRFPRPILTPPMARTMQDLPPLIHVPQAQQAPEQHGAALPMRWRWAEHDPERRTVHVPMPHKRVITDPEQHEPHPKRKRDEQTTATASAQTKTMAQPTPSTSVNDPEDGIGMLLKAAELSKK